MRVVAVWLAWPARYLCEARSPTSCIRQAPIVAATGPMVYASRLTRRAKISRRCYQACGASEAIRQTPAADRPLSWRSALCAHCLATLRMVPRPAVAIHLYTWCWHTGFGYLHTYIHKYIHTCIHTHIHTYVHACMHAYTHTYIHTFTFTFLHLHLHLHCITLHHITYHLRHTPSFFVTHHLSHTTLSHTTFYPHLCVGFLFLVGHSRAHSFLLPPAASPPAASHATSSHATCSHTTCPHTTWPHTQLTSTDNFPTHNLSTHNFSAHNLLTHTTSSQTTYPHTPSSHWGGSTL